MHRGVKQFAEISRKSGFYGFGRRKKFITAVRAVDDIKVPFNTAWGAVPLPTYVTITKNGIDHPAGVRWAIGNYTAGTAASYYIEGTLLVPKSSNPKNLKADLTVEVEHEAKTILANANSVYYDFCKLYSVINSGTGVLSTGDVGLQDLGGLNLDATPVNGCFRGRVLESHSRIYGMSRNADDCVSTGSPLISILSQNRIDVFLSFATSDGIPVGSTTLCGASDGTYAFSIYNNAGRINLTYNDGANTLAWQSNVCLINLTNPGYCFHLKMDYTANTITLTQDGVSVGGSVVSGTIASINPAIFNCSRNVYIGATNASGTVASCTEFVTMFRAAICSNITDADATKIIDYFRFYRYPFSSFIIPFLIGDSQSEGAAESGRLTNDGRYSATPSEIMIYHKTARDSANNGSWTQLTAGSTNELITGTTFSADVSLAVKIQRHTLGNVHMIKAGASGSNLITNWSPPLGNNLVIALTYYYGVAIPLIEASHPGKRLKSFFMINLLTNDQSVPDTMQNLARHISGLISYLRAYNASFATCPIYWTEVNTNVQNGNQLRINAAIRKYCKANLNVYFVSGNPKDELSDRKIRIRKIDLTTAQKLGVTATTSGGDDEHRSYLGMIAEGELIYNHLVQIGFI